MAEEEDYTPHVDGFIMIAKNSSSEHFDSALDSRALYMNSAMASSSPPERLTGQSEDPSSSQNKSHRKEQNNVHVSSMQLNPHMSVIETPPKRERERVRGSSKNDAPQKWNIKWSHSNADRIPPLHQVRKQQSLEQIRLIKEHQKIRDFFSKEQEDKDGKPTYSFPRPTAADNSSPAIGSKLPLVNKNLRHQQNHGQEPNKAGKKAIAMISRQYQQKKEISYQSSSIFSNNEVPASDRINKKTNQAQSDQASLKVEYVPDSAKNANKVVLQKMLLNKKQSGRYQTLEVKLPNHQKNSSNVRHTTDLTESASKDSTANHTISVPPGHTANTSNTAHQTMSYTEAGNYNFGSSISVQKNSVDSLIQPSLFVPKQNMRAASNFQEPHRKGVYGQNVSLHEPIRLQAANSVISYGSLAGDYGVQYEPSLRADGPQSVDGLRFLNSSGFREFDSNQMKLYTAVKQQQLQQSRQIVNDQLIPQDTSFSTAALNDTYQRTFVARDPIGAKRLKISATRNGLTFDEKQRDVLQRQVSLPATLGQHDEALQNFSQRERMSISILLQDQYSSSGAQHAPGEDDPLSCLQINYEDKALTKKKRMDSVLASLKLKRRTKFKAIPAKRANSIQCAKAAIAEGSAEKHTQSKQLQISEQTGLRNDETADSVEQASPLGGAEKSAQANVFKLDHEPQSASVKFKQFKEMLQQSVEEQDYVSESQDSNEGLNEQNDELENYYKDELFFRRSMRMQKEGGINLLEIIRKEPSQRDAEEREHFICHLKYRVPFFRGQSRELVTTLVEKLECVEFKQRESLMDQGEIGDCMYIIYSGECGVYIFKSEHDGLAASHSAVAILGANTAIGESAVIDKFDNGYRSATVLAHTEVVTFRLTKSDYQKILYQHQIMERQRRFEFLSNLTFFHSWDRVSLVDLNTMTEEIKLKKGTTVYDIGQDPYTIYVCRQGKLVQETIIEIDSYFRFPIDKKCWEIRKNTRTIRYKLQSIFQGSIFGHEEILQGYKRRSRVRCLTDCTLVYVGGEQMMKRWPPERVEYLRKQMRILDLDHIVNKITRYYKEKAKRNEAILDGASLNCHDFSGARSQFMQVNAQQKIQKLLPWINKCRQNSTQNLNLLHELKKVALLKTSEEKFVIHKDDPKSLMPSDEFMEKKHARFVMPEKAKQQNQQQSEIISRLNRRKKEKEQKHTSPKRTSLMGSSNLARIKHASSQSVSGDIFPWLAAKGKENFILAKNPTV